MMAQGRNLLDIFDVLWDNADVMEEILWLCFLGNLDARSLNLPLALDSIQPRSSSAPALEREQPSCAGGFAGDSSPAWARALPAPRALWCPSSAGSAGFALSPENECCEMSSARSGWRRWFLRLTGRFASLRWFTGPYLQLTRWSPDLDTRIFVLRGWASKGNV